MPLADTRRGKSKHEFIRWHTPGAGGPGVREGGNGGASATDARWRAVLRANRAKGRVTPRALVPPDLANLPKQTFRIMVSSDLDTSAAVPHHPFTTPRPVCRAASNKPPPDLRTRHDQISAHHDPSQFAGGQ